MFRILFSVALAAGAYFGPWYTETLITPGAGAEAVLRTGEVYAGETVGCLSEGRFSMGGACAPAGGLPGVLVTGTVLLGALSAALNVFGLVRVIGRATALFCLLAGAAGLFAVAAVAIGLVAAPGLDAADLRWGAYATGLFAGLSCSVGVGGMRGGSPG